MTSTSSRHSTVCCCRLGPVSGSRIHRIRFSLSRRSSPCAALRSPKPESDPGIRRVPPSLSMNDLRFLPTAEFSGEGQADRSGGSRRMATCRTSIMFFRAPGCSVDLFLDAQGVCLLRPVAMGAMQTGSCLSDCRLRAQWKVGVSPVLIRTTEFFGGTARPAGEPGVPGPTRGHPHPALDAPHF